MPWEVALESHSLLPTALLVPEEGSENCSAAQGGFQKSHLTAACLGFKCSLGHHQGKYIITIMTFKRSWKKNLHALSPPSEVSESPHPHTEPGCALRCEEDERISGPCSCLVPQSSEFVYLGL